VSSNTPPERIRITLEDLATVQVEPAVPQPIVAPAPAERSYGTVRDASDQVPAAKQERGSVFLQGWFYLGAAGLLGSLAGWGICEPGFADSMNQQHWGNYIMVPVLIALMSLGFGIAESIVERSVQKAILRTALSLPLGLLFGFVLHFLANMVFNLLLAICAAAGVQSDHSPAFWIARSIAWTVLGVVGGLVYGIVGQSFQKGKYGVLGGMIGAFIGGLLFDPILIGTGAAGGALSRAVGFGLFGMATGAMMGVVESALKDRWFYVTAGPLAGKQFILYKPQTSIGSDQKSDIYLFKDPSILPSHAILMANGTRITIRANGPVLVSGVAISNRVLIDGDLVQIGRYTFRYKERARG
jgi:Inner membrane component of T3SS, cytoplasmic domain